MRGRVALGIGAVAVVAGAVGAAAYGYGGAGERTPVASALPPATTTVTRATLTQTEKVSGTLGYGDAVTVAARSGGGTLTWLPPAGSTVKRGQPLYTVDNLSVVVLFGPLPAYRPLSVGVTGQDVKQLEENLSAFGYRGFTVDTTFSSATTTAVKAWQEALGLDPTGTVAPNQVVVTAGELRVAEHKATVGAVASGPVLTYTGTTRVVSVALDVAKQHLVKPGLAATVTLPDGRNVGGTVASVGTVATTSTTGQGTQASSMTTIDVVVSVADQSALGTLDSAPVELSLMASQRRDVLTVPVAALLALAEGGYGVQVVDGSTTRYVAVETGMFANGRVEVSGVDEGTTVGIPK